MYHKHMTISRRKVIGAGGVLATIGFAGCGQVKQAVMGPDPIVDRAESETSIGDAIMGQVTIQVYVKNEGGTGDVKVNIETEDEDGNVLDKFSKVVEIEGGEIRRVDMTISPSSGADGFTASAEPA